MSEVIIQTISRNSYGHDIDNKPNDHCMFDANFTFDIESGELEKCSGVWMETMEHYKNRVRSMDLRRRLQN